MILSGRDQNEIPRQSPFRRLRIDKYRWSHVSHTPPRGHPPVRHFNSISLTTKVPPPTMLKLFSLALAVFSFIVAVQCGGVPACPTDTGGPHPSSLTARGSICVFECPESNMEGNDLSSSIHDSARLNCRYTTSSTTGIQAACVYNKVEFLTYPEPSSANLVATVHRRIVEQRW